MIRYFSETFIHSKIFERFDCDIYIKIHVWGAIDIFHSVAPIENLKKKFGFVDELNCHHSFKKETVQGNNRKVIFKKLRPKFRYEHECVEFVKDLKHFIALDAKKEWDEVLPDPVALWASRRLQILEKKYGDACTDNYRVAKVGNTCQEKRYRRQKNKGCCGFYDCIDICSIDGKAYRLGFNYGH